MCFWHLCVFLGQACARVCLPQTGVLEGSCVSSRRPGSWGPGIGVPARWALPGPPPGWQRPRAAPRPPDEAVIPAGLTHPRELSWLQLPPRPHLQIPSCWVFEPRHVNLGDRDVQSIAESFAHLHWGVSVVQLGELFT